MHMKLITRLLLKFPVGCSKFVAGRKLILFSIIMLTVGISPAAAQTEKSEPSWWFGVAGGANYNRYNGQTSVLNADIHPTPGFTNGKGFGGYLAGVIEYHRPGSMWGIMVQQGADDRNGKFENGGRKLDANISYFTVEPSLVIMVPKTGFRFYAGPRFGFLWGSEFTYQESNKPQYPQKGINPEAYIRNLRKNPISMQVGLGYDLRLTPRMAGAQTIVSPFITFLPSLGQNIRTIESLKLNTVRAGIVFKAGWVSKD